ncbi:MAG: restriction endonuclease subunit S, partial [Candidatus Methanomethylophilus alvus]|nr:restriction endonuclease subunit S [Methanomethylophilus alvi]
MAIKGSGSPMEAVDEYFDMLIKSRFIEMFGHNQHEVKPLNGLFKTSSGGTPLKGKREYYDGGNIPWLTSGEVNNEHITEAKSMITELALQETSAKIPPLYSVLVSM